MVKKKDTPKEPTLFDSMEMLAREKKTDFEVVRFYLEKAFVTAYKDEKGNNVECRVFIDYNSREIKFMVKRTVVDTVTNPDTEISFEAARRINRNYKLGDSVEEAISMVDVFGRSNIHKMKSVIHQALNEVYKANSGKRFSEKKREIVSAIVLDIGEHGDVLVRANEGDCWMRSDCLIPGEEFIKGESIMVLVESIDMGENNKPNVKLSRNTSEMVKRLFEKNIPEITEGIVSIKSVAREAGVRTKIAVYSKSPDVDAVGACIGEKSKRIDEIRAIIADEKIDIVKYSDDKAEYIKAALAPAEVLAVEVRQEIETKKLDSKKFDSAKRPERVKETATAYVAEDQMKLAIGNKGLNVRLAANLTGCKIDVKPPKLNTVRFDAE